MNGKLALALLLNTALFSIVATCNDSYFEDGPMDMDPMMTMSGTAPFPENELNDLMLDMRDVPAPENNQGIESLAKPRFPVPVEDWSCALGGASDDNGRSVQETSDGGYVITGYTYSYGAGLYDVWLIKTDSAGNKLWDRTFGGTGNDYGESVQETSDGGYVIAGYTKSYGAGGGDVWLIKTNSVGNKLWDKTFGGTSGDHGYSVQQTSDGGYVIAGYTQSYGAGGWDVWLIKTDSFGYWYWVKTFGGTGNDVGYSVQETSDGGYVIAGHTKSYGAGGGDVWLIKTNSVGNKLWDKTFGGTGNDVGYSVQETSDGGYVIAGYTGSYGAGGYDVWLIKTDSAGNEMWNKTFGGASEDLGYSVQETSDGGYVIVGETRSYGAGGWDVWLLKTNSAGNKVWDKTFGWTNSDYGYSVQETADGGHVIAGRTSSYGAGRNDVWLVKSKPRCRLYYPDFTDSTNLNSWRSWFVIQNPTAKIANVHIVMRSRTGTLLYSGGTTIGPYSVGAIRPRNLVGSDCVGSAVVTSDQPLKAVCQIIRNSNDVGMSYPAIGPE